MQDRKVYGAEMTTFTNVFHRPSFYMHRETVVTPEGRRVAMFPGRDAVIEYVNAALAACGSAPLDHFLTGTGRRGWTRWAERKMVLPRWAWNRGYILHEVAHLVMRDNFGWADADHGPYFTGTMVAVVALTCGTKVAEELARDYREAWCDISEQAFTVVARKPYEEESCVA